MGKPPFDAPVRDHPFEPEQHVHALRIPNPHPPAVTIPKAQRRQNVSTSLVTPDNQMLLVVFEVGLT